MAHHLPRSNEGNAAPEKRFLTTVSIIESRSLRLTYKSAVHVVFK